MPEFEQSKGFSIRNPYPTNAGLTGSAAKPNGVDPYTESPIMQTKSWEQGYKDWKGKGNKGTMEQFRGEAEKWWASKSGQKYAKEKNIKHRILTEDPTTTKERVGGTKITKTETPTVNVKTKTKDGKDTKQVIKTEVGTTRLKGTDISKGPEGEGTEKVVVNPKGVGKGKGRKVFKRKGEWTKKGKEQGYGE